MNNAFEMGSVDSINHGELQQLNKIIPNDMAEALNLLV